MEARMLGVLGVAGLGVAFIVWLTVAQLRQERGNDSHQRRGLGILAVLLLVLCVLERGLPGTGFRSDKVSFLIHMGFALPTAVIILGIVITGFLSRKTEWQVSGPALSLHRLLNKPAGSGALLWLSGSIFTGLIFVVISLTTSKFG